MSDFHGPEESRALQERLAAEKTYDISTESLSEDEQKEIRERMRAVGELLRQAPTARYKIEVQFGKGRSTWKPFPGVISIFLSGNKLHGGGDEKIYLCPRKGCGNVIHPTDRIGAKALCRACDQMWNVEQLTGELYFFLTPPKWAAVIHRMFVKLEHNADIYCKYHPTDIRLQTAMEMARARGGEEVDKARRRRGLHIYPLKNIIKDTGNGAQLYDRFLAFINA